MKALKKSLIVIGSIKTRLKTIYLRLNLKEDTAETGDIQNGLPQYIHVREAKPLTTGTTFK